MAVKTSHFELASYPMYTSLSSGTALKCYPEIVMTVPPNLEPIVGETELTKIPKVNLLISAEPASRVEAYPSPSLNNLRLYYPTTPLGSTSLICPLASNDTIFSSKTLILFCVSQTLSLVLSVPSPVPAKPIIDLSNGDADFGAISCTLVAKVSVTVKGIVALYYSILSSIVVERLSHGRDMN